MASNEKFNFKLVFAVVAASLGSGFQHGYHTGVINVPHQVLKDWINATYTSRTGNSIDVPMLNLMWGISTSIMNIGGTLGGILCALAVTKGGPKGGLLFNNLLALIGTVLLGLAKTASSTEMLMVGRFVIGVNCGLNAGMSPMYLSEIAPVNLRGATASAYQLIVTIAILIAQILGLDTILGTENGWPWLFVVPIFFSIFQVITLIFCPESPRHLVGVKGDVDKAKKALQFLRNKEDVDDELATFKKADEEDKALPKVTYREMFQKRYLRIPLLIACLIMVAQQFSGINAVIFYSTGTFINAGLTGHDPQYATIGIGVVNVTTTIVALYLVEIAGRKTLLLFAFGGMAIVTVILSMFLKFSDKDKSIPWICIILVFVYIVIFAVGAGAIPWFLVTEIFSQAARPKAASLAVPTNWIANFIVTLTFPTIEYAVGPFVFLIYAVLNVIFFIFVLRLVPETKNKTVEEITSEWK